MAVRPSPRGSRSHYETVARSGRRIMARGLRVSEVRTDITDGTMREFKCELKRLRDGKWARKNSRIPSVRSSAASRFLWSSHRLSCRTSSRRSSTTCRPTTEMPIHRRYRCSAPMMFSASRKIHRPGAHASSVPGRRVAELHSAPGGFTLLGRLSEDGVGLGLAEGGAAGVCCGAGLAVVSGDGIATG